MHVFSALELLTLFDHRRDLLILVRRQHTNERHHSHHRSCPAFSESPRFRLCHFIIHGHHHVLWIAGDTLLLSFAHPLLVLVLLRLRSHQIRSRLFSVGRETQTAPQPCAKFIAQRMTLTDYPHTFIHTQTRLHSLPGVCHVADH